jgi:phosphatidate cytidylyltransferase
MAILALVTAWYGSWPFALLWTSAALLVLREWMALIGLAGWRLTTCWIVGSVAIAAAGMAAEVAQGVDPWTLAGILALGAAPVAALAGGRWAWAGAGVVYAAVIAVVPIDLRGHPGHGLVAVLWIFAVVWLTDICAYFVGRAFGGPKLWPAISPKKTWSGFCGGLLGGTLAALAVVYVARRSFGLGWYSGGTLIALTIVASIASQGGDLFESFMKRRFGVKDSSQLIPGHGGVMDRLDSFWAVCALLALALYGTGAH